MRRPSVSNNRFYLQVLISHLMFFVHRVSKNKNVTIHCDLFISFHYKAPAKNFFLQILTQVPGPRDIWYDTSVCECFDWDVVNFSTNPNVSVEITERLYFPFFFFRNISTGQYSVQRCALIYVFFRRQEKHLDSNKIHFGRHAKSKSLQRFETKYMLH